MTPAQDRAWIKDEFDWIHSGVHRIGLRIKHLDVHPRHFEEFEQRVLAAVRLLRVELDIPYTTHEQWREDQINRMRSELARLKYVRQMEQFKRLWHE